MFLKGGALVKDAYLTNSQSLWTFVAPVLGLASGLLKAKFIFRKNCEKNIQRIKALPKPRIWQFFRPRMLVNSDFPPNDQTLPASDDNYRYFLINSDSFSRKISRTSVV